MFPMIEVPRKRRSTTIYAYVQPNNKAWLEARSLQESVTADSEISASEVLDHILEILRVENPVPEEFYKMKRPRRGHKYSDEDAPSPPKKRT